LKGFDEDSLVQEPVAEHLEKSLGWISIYAHNSEILGLSDDGNGAWTGRDSQREVILKHRLRGKIEEINPGYSNSVYDDALREVISYTNADDISSNNREKERMIRDGLRIPYRNDEGNIDKATIRLVDYDNPDRNEFLSVRELWIQGPVYRRRPDIIGFVNGIPLIVCECKNIDKPLENAFNDNISDYKDTVPHLFHHAAIVMLTNGEQTKFGTITSGYEHFHEWKRVREDDEPSDDPRIPLNGVMEKTRLLDIVENFTMFDDSSGELKKILAKNHQYLGVNRTIRAIECKEELEGKLGVFWHTQGSGKSYSMVFLTKKVHRKISGGYTFIIVTDRKDLDEQIYTSFAGCGVANDERDPCRAKSGENLKELLALRKTHVFTLINKFNQDIDENVPYTTRDDVIVISDEAHRTQYGLLALNMRNALPNAGFLGFTGTPLMSGDEKTRLIFGDYVSRYDFHQAVIDGATVPLYFDSRGSKLTVNVDDVNEIVAEAIEDMGLEEDEINALEVALGKNYHVMTKPDRLEDIAKDVVEHYSRAFRSGKAMLVCLDKLTCMKMEALIQRFWQDKITELEDNIEMIDDVEDLAKLNERISWMQETLISPIFSEQQGEVAQFNSKGFDIIPFRSTIKHGFELEDGSRMDAESAFKEENHPFRLAIVCAMWLTGFDVPSLGTLYLDKPLKEHTLMQSIARANRVNEGKENGMIVDYCGIMSGSLDKALSIYAGNRMNGETIPEMPTRPAKELLKELEEVINEISQFLLNEGASLDTILQSDGLGKAAAIVACKEAVNRNDETRKEFEVLCRIADSRFRAAINLDGINDYRLRSKAISIVYRSLISDRDSIDISDVIGRVQEAMDNVIGINDSSTETEPIDISKIDFNRLNNALQQSKTLRTETQNLRQAVDKRLDAMLSRNPTRIDLHDKYTELVRNYNLAKDQAEIERIFQQLLVLVSELDEEEARAIQNGMTEESLVIFDILRKPGLTVGDEERVRATSIELLHKIKQGIENLDNWFKKEQTKDKVSQTIHDFLYDELTGLPESYETSEINELTSEVFRHTYRVYKNVPSEVFS
jgi:type I restriction enzyme, R subunit